jgi:hypothetical protein
MCPSPSTPMSSHHAPCVHQPTPTPNPLVCAPPITHAGLGLLGPKQCYDNEACQIWPDLLIQTGSPIETYVRACVRVRVPACIHVRTWRLQATSLEHHACMDCVSTFGIVCVSCVSNLRHRGPLLSCTPVRAHAASTPACRRTAPVAPCCCPSSTPAPSTYGPRPPPCARVCVRVKALFCRGLCPPAFSLCVAHERSCVCWCVCCRAIVTASIAKQQQALRAQLARWGWAHRHTPPWTHTSTMYTYILNIEVWLVGVCVHVCVCPMQGCIRRRVIRPAVEVSTHNTRPRTQPRHTFDRPPFRTRNFPLRAPSQHCA